MSAEKSWERRGLDLLLAEYPVADVINARRNIAWLCVDLLIDRGAQEFAIWQHTGCVYKVDEFGAAAEDPLLIPEGSPYNSQARID